MNRRNFIVSFSVLTALPLLGFTSGSVQPRVHLKRLSPNVREVHFFNVERAELHKPFQVRSKGNAIWIDKVLWQDVDGTRHLEMIRKNLALGKTMAFPAIKSATTITFVVTCLPLASTITTIALLG